jgi:hypothetical protein
MPTACRCSSAKCIARRWSPAATSGDPKFFLGTDSAPHGRGAKESDCGCAGVYTAHAAIELYAEAFDLAGALDKLEAFASFHGPDFYGLPRNRERITLHRESWTVPVAQPFGDTELVPMRAGESIPGARLGASPLVEEFGDRAGVHRRRFGDVAHAAHAFVVRGLHFDVVHVGAASLPSLTSPAELESSSSMCGIRSATSSTCSMPSIASSACTSTRTSSFEAV